MNALLLVALVVLVGLIAEAMRRSARARALEGEGREALREECLAVEGWPMELTVRQGRAVTGCDKGVVWFEEGRLYFSGQRTSFGLVASQVQQGQEKADAMGTMFDLPLKGRTGIGSLSIRLIPLLNVSFGTVGYRGGEAFARELQAWIVADASGEGQLPPLALGPDAPTASVLLGRAVRSTALWSLMSVASGLLVRGALAAGGFEGFAAVLLPILVFGGVILVCCPEVWGPFERWRVWRDRRRLDAALRQNSQR